MLCTCICLRIENNCARSISNKSSKDIVFKKGIFSGLGNIVIALLIGEKEPEIIYIFITILFGFISYDLIINFYIKAQKNLGAAKTSAFYSVSPFLGVGFSFVILGESLLINYALFLLSSLLAL